MKLILLSDVKALGKQGQVVDVAEGYARNFLLPRKLAAEANKGALAMIEGQKRAQQKRDAQALANTQELATLLETKPVAVSAKAGGNGKLFGAVTNADVADAIAKTFNVDVDKHKVEIKASIKALGTYPVEVRLGKNIVAKTSVNVVSA
ncbi:MAG: 50S ribosomal protein L9 [Candidatus Eremiobacteraeota bacterium]|nr:50S ribosomal protein L9 [Candidatus Eremiobacteraeota bacterium]